MQPGVASQVNKCYTTYPDQLNRRAGLLRNPHTTGRLEPNTQNVRGRLAANSHDSMGLWHHPSSSFVGFVRERSHSARSWSGYVATRAAAKSGEGD